MRSALPPGPRYPSLIQGVGMWKRPLASLERHRARYGKRFTVRFPASPPFVILSDPADVKQVFAAPPEILHPGEGAKVLKPLVGENSVILLDEAAHLEQRKLLLPAFHGEKMARLSGLMGEVAEREVESWPRDREIELQPRMGRLTLEIILRAVFGLDPGERLDALRSRLAELLTFGERPISVIPIDPDGRVAKLLSLMPRVAAFWRMQEEIDALMFELIEERRAEGTERDDVLTMLLEARHEDGSPMSDQELRDELMTMLVAGHETTATSLAWAFERLLRTPRVLDRLVDELGSNGDAYLTATIQETLRRRPVLPNVEPRLVKQEFDLGGWRYPPGVCLVPNAYLIHHDPEIYPEPYKFRPERFLDESPGTYTWIPFGGGRRRCIGASFAMLEMQIVLRTVFTRCELRRAGDAPELTSRRNITVRPGRGARVVIGDRAAVARAPSSTATPA
jgi:cytochrome P450